MNLPRCCTVVLASALAASTPAAEPALSLMPWPAEVAVSGDYLAIDAGFRVDASGCPDARVAAAAARLVTRVAAATGLRVLADSPAAPVVVTCRPAPTAVQAAVEDESYTLTVAAPVARLAAASPYGALRGLESFLQLIEPGPGGWRVPCVRVADRPRFPWRGLLLDSGRHFMPVVNVKRTLDGMAAVKLNVLHWHLTEDQGFRVESLRYPRLHRLGSDGQYYTQAQVRDVVAYAAARGIRVVPEFDVPGHTTSWLVGHPELAALPGPYPIERRWGVFDPVMDPSNDGVYRFLDRFLGEMAALFPDRFVHVGGDEVNGKQWDASPAVAAFKLRHGLADNHALQAHFNRRLQRILAGDGKTMVGWDEILDPNLPSDIVIQSWRGPDSLAAAASAGLRGILSSGYYLDHLKPAAAHYAVDPLAGAAGALPPEARARVLGGEACMWSEFVSAEMLDGRVWPRAAAVAERLWSPADVTDVDDMSRRLETVGRRLELEGLEHRSGPRRMLARLVHDRPPAPLEAFAAVLEPLGLSDRARTRQYTSLVSLNRLVDAVPPESGEAARFGRLVDGLLADPSHREGEEDISHALAAWRRLPAALETHWTANPMLAEAQPLADDLAALSALGLQALPALRGGTVLELRAEDEALLERALEQRAELRLAVAPPLRRLIEAAAPARSTEAVSPTR
jgi:hexosaminidase